LRGPSWDYRRFSAQADHSVAPGDLGYRRHGEKIKLLFIDSVA